MQAILKGGPPSLNYRVVEYEGEFNEQGQPLFTPPGGHWITKHWIEQLPPWEPDTEAQRINVSVYHYCLIEGLENGRLVFVEASAQWEAAERQRQEWEAAMRDYFLAELSRQGQILILDRQGNEYIAPAPIQANWREEGF